mgnify:CR=1 FL=1
MNTFNLTAKQHTSRVLANWAQTRPGAAQRMQDVVDLVPTVHNTGSRYAVSSDSDAMAELFAPINAASGFAVTDRTALAVSTVYACLSKLAGAVLQLPVNHYRYDPQGDRKTVIDSPYWWMLNEQPHARWTSAAWKEWIVRCVALRGDQCTRIVRGSANAGGPIIGLEPWHPDNVVIRRWIDTAAKIDRLVYDHTDPITGKCTSYDQDDVLHFTGFGFDGIRSLSAIQYAAKQAIGNALAAAEYTGRTIGEGAMPQIALTYPDKMNPEQAAQLRASFVATYTGVGARKLPLVLTQGGDVKELSISPVDMQLIESRRFEKEDICQALEVPPVLIGDNDKTSSWGSGIEQITLGFVKFTVKPKLTRWQEEINRKFFRNAGQFVEFQLDGLLAGDSKAQSEFFKSALGGPGTGDGYMTVNEVRRIKNLPRLDGGDELYKAQRGTPNATTTTTTGTAP